MIICYCDVLELAFSCGGISAVGCLPVGIIAVAFSPRVDFSRLAVMFLRWHDSFGYWRVFSLISCAFE